MTRPDVQALIVQGIAVFSASDRDRAYALLTETLHADPHNEAGWLWMSGVVQEPAERRYCLERVVETNPQACNCAAWAGQVPRRSRRVITLPAPEAEPAEVARWTFPGCTQPVAPAGHTLGHPHWKEQGPAAPSGAAQRYAASIWGARLRGQAERRRSVV